MRAHRLGWFRGFVLATALTPVVLFGGSPAWADLISAPAAPSASADATTETRAGTGDDVASRERQLTQTESDYFRGEPARVRVAAASNLGLTLAIIGVIIGAAVIWFGATHEEWPW